MIGKPFIKWAGGKTQLLDDINNTIPEALKNTDFTYIEPFVGGGAVLFYMLNHYPNLKKVIINDINSDLVATYKAIKTNVSELIDILEQWETEYHKLSGDEEGKKEYFYSKRSLFNSRSSESVIQSALFIFLNRTCFNGLYRVNRKNEFNVPIGSYKRPMICDKNNLLTVNQLLQKVEILNGDFEKTLDYVGENTFFYFDPPYKPLNATSSFNSYAKDEFGDSEQIRLARYCTKLDELGYAWSLSNSDVKGANQDDDFFDKLFENFNISRVYAKRNINSNASKRGRLTELLISNRKDDYAKVV